MYQILYTTFCISGQIPFTFAIARGPCNVIFLILYSICIQLTPWKLRIGIKYYIVHTVMYSMPYYTYGSTANFLFLEPTALIYIKITTL